MKSLIFFFLISFSFAQNIIIKYENLKKYYYENQIINLKIRIITPKDYNLTIIKPLNSEINITKTSPFIYNINLKYQNTDKIKKLLILGPQIYHEIILNTLYQTKKLEKIPNYCNVLADNLKIYNIIASKYNNQYNLISFTLTAKNANLKNFTLNLKDENLTLLSNKQATFLGLIKKNKNKLIFYYFNTKEENFKKISLPINIKEETISTQTNLTPKENTLFTPINILILIIIAFLIIIFLVYQKIWLLIFPIALSAYLIINNLPKGETILNKGTKVYILPTKNSTIFYITKFDTRVEILKKLKNYTKIKINNKIGWVSNEDIK